MGIVAAAGEFDEHSVELSAEHHVGASTYDRAVKAFGETGIVDMIHLIGLYLTICALPNALEVPVPGEAPNWRYL